MDLAIIGGGVAGIGLLYTLSKEEKVFNKVTLFNSELFAKSCTVRSTAIIAPRGVTKGHSLLGDLLLEGYQTFFRHFEDDKPLGVEKVLQYTGATSELESFKRRYPGGEEVKGFLRKKTYLVEECAFLIHPETYLKWLVSESRRLAKFEIQVIEDLVKEVIDDEAIELITQNGKVFSTQKVVFATGAYSRFWGKEFVQSKPVQGSYLEFNQVELGSPSFSLTLNSNNLIWNNTKKLLLVGSTSQETGHELPPLSYLKKIYEYLKDTVDFEIPDFDKGRVLVGSREKASKRMPYLKNVGNKIFLGGLYKNGFSLSLKMASDLSRQYL